MQIFGIKVPQRVVALLVGLTIVTSASHQVVTIVENFEATTTTVISIAEHVNNMPHCDSEKGTAAPIGDT